MDAVRQSVADRFAKPTEVSKLDMVFGGRMQELMPAYQQIPDEFKRGGNKWVEWQAKWFYSGLDSMPTPKDGIDGKKAMHHLAAIQNSFEPKHEHKSAAVAFLASLWFKRP
jgi:hypothetical protein